MMNNTLICKLSVDKAQELARDYTPFALTLNKNSVKVAPLNGNVASDPAFADACSD